MTIDCCDYLNPEREDIDVFVTVDDENIGPENYHWKAEYSICPITIDPNTDVFHPGLFRIKFVTKVKNYEVERSISSAQRPLISLSL